MSMDTCSVHGKMRSLPNLVDDGEGGMRCALGFECKTEAPPPGVIKTQICSKHGKKRNLQSLEDDGQGGKCCKEDCQCRMTTVEQGGELEQYTCSVHGKLRAVSFLGDDGKGGVRCIAGYECREQREWGSWDDWGSSGKGKGKGITLPGMKGKGKGKASKGGDDDYTAGLEAGMKMAMAMAGIKGGGGGWNSGIEAGMKMMLAAMGKGDSWSAPSGPMVVLPSGKTGTKAGGKGKAKQEHGSSQLECAVHGKWRGRRNMVEQDDGTWVCAPGMECIVSDSMKAADPY